MCNCLWGIFRGSVHEVGSHQSWRLPRRYIVRGCSHVHHWHLLAQQVSPPFLPFFAFQFVTASPPFLCSLRNDRVFTTDDMFDVLRCSTGLARKTEEEKRMLLLALLHDSMQSARHPCMIMCATRAKVGALVHDGDARFSFLLLSSDSPRCLAVIFLGWKIDCATSYSPTRVDHCLTPGTV
jgi:hypothetical protein